MITLKIDVKIIYQKMKRKSNLYLTISEYRKFLKTKDILLKNLYI